MRKPLNELEYFYTLKKELESQGIDKKDGEIWDMVLQSIFHISFESKERKCS